MEHTSRGQPTRTALVAAIRAAPADDAPRLACAAWFATRPDDASRARAEFIHVQLARARLPPADPAQAELEARELRLLGRWAASWCRPHFLRKARFRRGFIEAVHLHLRHFLQHRRQLLALEPVRDICLTGWFRSNLELPRRVARCAEWQAIESLRIHHQGAHKSPRHHVLELLASPHLKKLRALSLPMLALDRAARQRFEALALLAQLECLSLPTLDSLEHRDAGALFSEDPAPAMPRLRRLVMPWWTPPLPLLERLCARPAWSSLQSLELKIGQDGTEILRLLGKHLPPQLEELSVLVSCSPVQLPGLTRFAADLAQRPLRRLQLDFPLAGSALQKILGSTGRLQHLQLPLSAVPDETPALAGIHTLEGADEEVQAALLAQGRLPSLTSVDTSCSALLQAQNLPALRHVQLADTDLPTMQKLVERPFMQHVTRLDFELPGPLPAELARCLALLPCLEHLRLHTERACPPEVLGSLREGMGWVETKSYDDSARDAYAKDAPANFPPLDDSFPRYRD